MHILPIGSGIFDPTTRTQAQGTVSTKVDVSLKETKQGHPEQSRLQMETIVACMNDFMKPMNVAVRFELHDDLNEYYVTVVDVETDEVVREIPSKKFLDMYAAMTEYMGLFVDKKI
ncbi:flagellar protein FlaG [Sutcliffiella horikoshii]|uniref:flagellar protein FlaG n=1 Tax=Sutcliffiella horikoshii TaxID=79883 RepID=UPI001F3B4258|nr:flagellar protein FlaG [Sutcliffiella horikoshii]MCG1021588.1 flagellar protein FlaG [Sutcliffiella horikoshii]